MADCRAWSIRLARGFGDDRGGSRWRRRRRRRARCDGGRARRRRRADRAGIPLRHSRQHRRRGGDERRRLWRRRRGLPRLGRGRHAQRRERAPSAAADLAFAYRHSRLPHGAVVVRARLRARRGEPAAIAARMAEIRAAREATQPVRARTGGSTFRNPPDMKAWELIDAAGCRGLTRGGAQVSEKHCNFLINTGTRDRRRSRRPRRGSAPPRARRHRRRRWNGKSTASACRRGERSSEAR